MGKPINVIGKGPTSNSGYIRIGIDQHRLIFFGPSGTNAPVVIDLSNVAKTLCEGFFRSIRVPDVDLQNTLKFMFDGKFAIVSFQHSDDSDNKLVYYAFYKIAISEEKFSEDIQNVENWGLLTYVRSPGYFKLSDKAVAKNGILILALSDPRKVEKNVSFYMFRYDNIIPSAHKTIEPRGCLTTILS